VSEQYDGWLTTPDPSKKRLDKVLTTTTKDGHIHGSHNPISPVRASIIQAKRICAVAAGNAYKKVLIERRYITRTGT